MEYKMNNEQIKNLSMNGRMAYSIMCIEKFLMQIYPEKSWEILSREMWKVTNMYWDEWDFRFMEVMPQYLFEKSNYEESEFEYITEDEYDAFCRLYKGSTSGDESDELVILIDHLHQLAQVYSYSDIPGVGEESLIIIESLCMMLQKKNVELPDASILAFSDFKEKSGWGNFFEGNKYSLVI
ncbi:MAG: hypothetical protein MJ171_01385 [Clostridia bacterium]|nr:hypothetical protein [Clostridia bacterium]